MTSLDLVPWFDSLVLFIISLILLLGFWIWVLGSVHSYSLVPFIIYLIFLVGFFIWVLGSVYFCLDFVASLVEVGSIDFLCSALLLEFVVIFFVNFFQRICSRIY